MDETSATWPDETLDAENTPDADYQQEEFDQLFSLADSDILSYSTGSDEGDWDESDWNDTDSYETKSRYSDSSYEPGHYESTSVQNIEKVAAGRWIYSNLITEVPLAPVGYQGAAVSSFAEFASFLTSFSQEINPNRRFFDEKEYIRLDETLLSEVFVLSVCLNIIGAPEGTSGTLASHFFSRKWTEAVRDFRASLSSQALSRRAFETTFDLRWIEHDF